MESNEREFICYNLLCDVFIDNAYSSLQLNSCLSGVKDERDRAYITNLFYGVLEKNVQLDYIVRCLVSKKPKTSIEILIKIGLYRMKFMQVPIYAAVNETVKLTKRLGKSGVSGFVNAVLRRSEIVELPKEEDGVKFLSVNYSVPLWICKKLICQYGYEFTKEFLACPPVKLTHIRHNSRVINKADFEAKLKEFNRSELGYNVDRSIVESLDRSSYTVQSLSSMIAVNCYCPHGVKSPVVLDLCGAPGGKAVYLEELIPDAQIYCCDLHPHRVELIKKYAKRMRSSIKPNLSDATAICPEWVNKCDIVICDVPCSGLGVYKNKPDILFNKTEDDIIKLQRLQRNILENAKNYVKSGGALCYSTCTILREENEDNITQFLTDNPQFSIDKIDSPYAGEDGMVHLFPHTHPGCDGFFVARLRRNS